MISTTYSEWFINNIDDAKSIYDLVACTYRALMYELKNGAEENFLALFGNMNVGIKSIVEMFEEDILCSLQKMFTIEDEKYLSFFDVVDRIKSGLKSLTEMRTDSMQDFTLFSFGLYGILRVCDCYWQQCEYEEKLAISGGLNKNFNTTKCMVYAKEPSSSFRSPLYFENKLRARPERIRIATSFYQYLIYDYDTDRLREPPTIFRLPEINNTQTLNIACVPMIDEMYIEIIEINTRKIYKTFPPVGLTGNFCIRIQKDYEKIIREHALRVLSKAIDEGANIVVFPEYAIDRICLLGLQKYIIDNQKKIANTNFAGIIAGSRYEFDQEKGDNVLSVISRQGDLYDSVYYKESPYCEFTNGMQWPQQRVDRDDLGRKEGIERCEWLSNPGKKSCLIDIGGIGRILPSICKDSLTGYSKRIANQLFPSFVISAAWSRSTGFFEESFREMANMQHVTSILCNNCFPCHGGNEPDILCAVWCDGRMNAKIKKYPCMRAQNDIGIGEVDTVLRTCKGVEKEGGKKETENIACVNGNGVSNQCDMCIIWMNLTLSNKKGSAEFGNGIEIGKKQDQNT